VLEGRIEAPGGTILDDGSWHVDQGIGPPLRRGWLIVKSQRHIESVADLRAADSVALGPLLRRLTGAMQRAFGAERVYVCLFGEAVRHVHFHLIPRTSDMPPEGPRLMPDLFSDERRWGCSAEEAAAAAEEVRKALAG